MGAKRLNYEEAKEKAEYLRILWQEFYSSGEPLNDFLAQNEFAPLIGTICDEQINAKDAWNFPEWLYGRVGEFSLPKLLEVNYKEMLEEYLEDKWPKGMKESDRRNYIEKISKAIREALEFFQKKGKSPITIFENRSYTALEVYFMLREIPGFGPKKASMITRDFIYRSLGLSESHPWFDQVKAKSPNFNLIDGSFLDMPIDVHVVKVFNRIFGLKFLSKRGWRSELPNHVQDILAFSKLVFPDLPVKLDNIFWEIGRKFCNERNPDCEKCPIMEICDSASRQNK